MIRTRGFCTPDQRCVQAVIPDTAAKRSSPGGIKPGRCRSHERGNVVSLVHTSRSAQRGGRMRVLVAGDRGYIGAVLVPSCARPGTRSTGSTSACTRGATSAPRPDGSRAPCPRTCGTSSAGQLAGYDAVMCLAALSNDPLGDLNPAATYSVNLDGTLHLARAAKEAGVERFLFASSCSLYGAAGSGAVAEDADLFPVTPYGETKVTAERGLSLLADDNFSPTYLRNATAYGASTAAAPGHRGEQPHRRRDDHRPGAAGKRRHAVAAAGAHRGHQPRLPRHAGGAARAGARPGVQRRARRRTTCRSATSPRWSATRCPGRRCRSPTAPDRTCATTASTSPSSTTPSPSCGCSWSVREGIDELARGLHQVRPDLRRLRVVAVRPAAPDPRAARRRARSTRCCAGQPADSAGRDGRRCGRSSG